MPAALRRGTALLALAGLALFLPIRFQVDVEFHERLMDAMHLPAFAALTLLLWDGLQRVASWNAPTRGIAAGTGAGTLAGLVEIIQPFTGRMESLPDFCNASAGAILAAAGCILWETRAGSAARCIHGAAAVGAILWTLGPAAREARALLWRETNFPILADFESRNEEPLWQGPSRGDDGASNTEWRRAADAVSHGRNALRVRTAPGHHPGVRLLTGEQDWDGYGTLAFDVFNMGAPFTLALRIDDDAPHGPGHQERYNGKIALGHGWTHARIPLEEIARGPRYRFLRMHAIRRVIFFVNEPTQVHEFAIDYPRLEK